MLAKPKADLIYGATKTRKTSMIAELAEYVYERYGLITRVLHGDTGGCAPLEPLVDLGIVQLLPLIGREHPLESIDRVAQGYWPDDKKKVWSKDGLDKVGAYGLEGLTSFSNIIHLDFKRRRVKLSQDPAFVYKDGETEYAGGNQAYIGEIQNRVYDLVTKSSMLPVKHVLWTAHEADKAGTDNTKMPQYGPAIIGKAMTAVCGAWFGNFLHLEQVTFEKGLDPATKQIKLETRPVMYLRPHADPMTKIPFHAGTRAIGAAAKELPEFYDPPSIRKLYEFLEASQGKEAERLRQKFPQLVTA